MAPEVKVRLSVEGTPEALAAFRSVQAQAQVTGRASGKAFAPLAGALSGIKGLLAGAAAAFSVGALVSFGKGVIDSVESMGRMAVGLGTTVEHMSGLSVAATLADSDLETVSGTVGKLAKSVDGLKNGAPAATAAFARLGLTAKDFAGDDTAVWYETVARKLSQLADGGAKTAVAMALMGKNARMALPTMKQLIDLGGLQGAEARARAMGVMVDAETLARVADLADAMKILKMEATGVALQFVRGFSPGVVTAIESITKSVEPGGTSAFQALGVAIGWCLRAIVGLGAIGFAVLNSRIEATRATLLALQGASELIARGKFGAASTVLRVLDDVYAEIDRKEKSAIADAWALMTTPPPALPGAKTPDGRDRVQDEAEAVAASAALARQKQAIEDELKLKLSAYKQEEDDAKRAYDGYLIGLDRYFALRRDLVEKRLAAEVDALNQQRALADKEKDPAKRGAEQGRIATVASAVALEAEAQLKAIASDEAEAINQAAMAALEAHKKIHQARGEAHEARMLEIAQEALSERQLLARAGVKGPELEAGVAAFKARAVALADFEEQLRQANATLDDLQGSADVTPEQIQRLRDLATALEQAAGAFGPDAVKNVQDVTDSLDEMAARGDTLKPWAESLESALGNWLGSTITQVNSLSDAFRSLGLAILQAVQQMLAAEIATQILSWIPGTKQAPTGKAHGGLIRGPGGPMSDAVFALLSNGEYVVRASAVARPGMLGHLEAINRGAAPRYANPADDVIPGIRRYALGGLANARPMAAAGSSGVQLSGGASIELSEGLIARRVDAYLQSSEGQRTQIKIINKNRRVIGGALR
jgi:hypothetical protein